MSAQTDSLLQWDADYVWHPFTPMKAHAQEQVPVIQQAEGFFLIDTEGNRYLDGVSSLWCNVHGHQVPEIDQAIISQLQQVAHSTLLGLSSRPSIELAKKLAELCPGDLQHVFFSDAGATAVEAALKIAVQYYAQRKQADPQRTRFARLSESYHGDTIGSVSVGRIASFHRPFQDMLFDVVELPCPSPHARPAGMSEAEYRTLVFEQTDRILHEHASQLAAVVMEPLCQGAGGILTHYEGYLAHVRQLTQENDILLIADEVAVGFGKTGKLFACEQEQVVPDLLCMAKGLTGGYLPVAATIARPEIFQAFWADPVEMKTFFHGHTYTGNPLGCAAALATIELIEKQQTLQNAQAISKRITAQLKPLKAHQSIGAIRQCGVMTGIPIQNADGTEIDPALRIGHLITREARSRGGIIRPLGNVVVLMPAIGMPVDLIDQLCQVTIESINAVLESL